MSSGHRFHGSVLCHRSVVQHPGCDRDSLPDHLGEKFLEPAIRQSAHHPSTSQRYRQDDANRKKPPQLRPPEHSSTAPDLHDRQERPFMSTPETTAESALEPPQHLGLPPPPMTAPLACKESL